MSIYMCNECRDLAFRVHGIHAEPLETLNLRDMQVLYALLENEYISYENLEAHEVLRKLDRLIKVHELAGRNS